jgi:hypothetical protein
MAILEHAYSTLDHSVILCFPFILEVGSNVCHTIFKLIMTYSRHFLAQLPKDKDLDYP